MLEAVGLDSYLGFLHAPSAGRPSLALDVIEPLRSKIIDRMTLAGVNLGVFTPDDFETHKGGDGAVLLNAQGRRKYFSRYEHTMSNCTREYAGTQCKLAAPRGAIERECQSLKRYIQEQRLSEWRPQHTPFDEFFNEQAV